MNLMSNQVNCFGLSDIGHVRNNNEDAFELLIQHHFFVLADGMGGHNAGEVASTEAIKSICRSVRYAPAFSTEEQISHYLLQAIDKANQRVWKLSLEDAAFGGMGTTLSCIWIHGDRIIYGHIGDSRIYRFRNRKLQQITRDHSLRAMLQEEEDIDKELLDQPGFKNVLTKALGTQPHVMPDIGVISMAPNDIFLLCSDGLTDQVLDSQIALILDSGKTAQKMCESLISAALESGGNDNITVLVVKTD